MFNKLVFVYLISLLLTICVAIPKPDDDDSPQKPQHNPLERDSKHEKHYDGMEHNAEYDHEAFLGEEEAKTFQQLPPEESKRRLGLIVDRIDQDNDGFVSLDELKRWIEYVERRYVDEDVTRVWQQHNADNSTTISWETYRDNVYGFLDKLTPEELEYEENGVSYKKMITRDRRRWGVADKDLDDALTREEFTAFLHPEEHPNMQDVVLMETIDDMDKDKDGKVSVEEYIGDMYKPNEEGEEEPEWITSERQSFAEFRDTNGDGFMDKEEVRSWIMPKDYKHSQSEATHLMFESDQNDDGLLTKEEILNKYDVFVGSQATNFGDELARHDEF